MLPLILFNMSFTIQMVLLDLSEQVAVPISYNTSSDYRLKENVAPMTGAADRVKALKPCRFNFKVEADKTVGMVSGSRSTDCCT